MPLHCVGVRSHLGVKKCLSNAQIGLLQCCPQSLVAFLYHSSSRAAILESKKTQMGMRLGLSHLGVKKVLAMPGLVSFNFKLMSEHPFHFPMAVLTLGVFFFSEEVCRIMPKVTPNLITNSPFDYRV